MLNDETSEVLRASVIICTRNPRLSTLQKALGGLKAQSTAVSEWEILIVDNGSDKPVEGLLDVGWHPNVRYVHEMKPGLVHARITGIKESRSPLLIFVDDDNVLPADYVALCLQISERHPTLGAWSGQVKPQFEVSPPRKLEPFLASLCLRKFDRDVWGNLPIWAHMPAGAGMCVRKSVADMYIATVKDVPMRLSLGHKANEVSCHDDTDLAMTSLDMGLGVGLFKDLIVFHWIVEKRLTEQYLLKLVESGTAAFIMLRAARKIPIEDPPRGIDRWIMRLKYFQMDDIHRRFERARLRGEASGRELMARHLMEKF